MTSAVYPKWKEARAQSTANAALDGSGATGVYAALIDTGVTGYNAAHEFFSSLASAQIGTEVELGTKTYTGGLFDAANSTFTAVSGNSAEAIVLFVKNAGANTTWRLFAWIDQASAGLPVTPNGGNIDITWNASGIVQI